MPETNDQTIPGNIPDTLRECIEIYTQDLTSAQGQFDSRAKAELLETLKSMQMELFGMTRSACVVVNLKIQDLSHFEQFCDILMDGVVSARLRDVVFLGFLEEVERKWPEDKHKKLRSQIETWLLQLGLSAFINLSDVSSLEETNSSFELPLVLSAVTRLNGEEKEKMRLEQAEVTRNVLKNTGRNTPFLQSCLEELEKSPLLKPSKGTGTVYYIVTVCGVKAHN